MTSFSSPEEIISFFDDYDLSQSNRDYLHFHALRYFILWKEVLAITNKSTIKILDIGPGFFTELLGQKLKSIYPSIEIYCLGLKSDYIPFKSKIDFIHYDLNDLYLKPENIPKLEQFDLIVCAEVLEHLYTGIDAILETFAKWLKLNGRIIIQTPNAASLHHRIKLLSGKNPFPPLRPNPLEPGHYREYTLGELKTSLEKAGLNPTKIETHNYFNYKGSWKNNFYKSICNLLPSAFKDGVTIISTKI